MCPFANRNNYNACIIDLPLSIFVSSFFLHYHVGADLWYHTMASAQAIVRVIRNFYSVAGLIAEALIALFFV